MHPLLVPPEALEPTGTSTAKPGGWTGERVALSSLLAVTVSLTAGTTFSSAPVTVPCSALVAYGFWRVARRITKPGAMLVYNLAGGAVAGVVCMWLNLFGWLMLAAGATFVRHLSILNMFSLGMIGAVVGAAYGFVCLPPMLAQLSARPLRRTEGVDSCLICCGTWGVFVLGIGFGLLSLLPGSEDSIHRLVSALGSAGFVLHGSSLVLGTLRWARRRWWLAQVARGNVSGWLVCDRQRFRAAQLEGLQIFSSPLFARPPANQLRVLACGDGSDAYRSTPLTPKYWVV